MAFGISADLPPVAVSARVSAASIAESNPAG